MNERSERPSGGAERSERPSGGAERSERPSGGADTAATDVGPGQAPPPPPPQPPLVRRLVRSQRGKVVGGVCAGLGRSFAVDPVIFRVGFAVTTLFWGSGLLVYLLAWLLLPDAETGTSVLDGAAGGATRSSWLPTALLVVGAIALVGDFDDEGPPFPLVLLAAGGYLLWRREQGGGPSGPAPPPSAPRPEWRRPVDAPWGAPPTSPPPSSSADVGSWSDRPATRAPRSTLGPLTSSAILLLAGICLLLGTSLEAFLALALLAVGAALVVGSRFGHSRGIILVGAALAVVATGVSLVDLPALNGVGERQWRPASLADLERSYQLGAGSAVLDLTGIAPGATDVGVHAEVAMGELIVLVPEGEGVVVEARAGMGDLDLFGDDEDGLDVRNRASVQGRGRNGDLVLDLEVGMGSVEVRRVAA